MTYLLDTHVFLWWVSDAEGISETARDAIQNPENSLLVSAVCGWEIAIKAGLGRLELDSPPASFVSEHLNRNSMGVLPISMHHALEVYDLPPHHRDPFDRLLIAQSRSEGLPIISSDAVFARYDVAVVW